MTPQPERDPDLSINLHLNGEPHLTSDQIGELLDFSTSAGGEPLSGDPACLGQAELHLRSCQACAAEFASLRDALSLFREASFAYTDRELRQMPRLKFPEAPAPARYPSSQSLFWVAASAVLVAGIVPLQARWQKTLRPAQPVIATSPANPVQSDEALLEEINREIYASFPTSMQALADPTSGSNAQASVQKAPTSTPGKE